MTKRIKREIALLLTAALVLTMNSVAFASRTVDAEILESDEDTLSPSNPSESDNEAEKKEKESTSIYYKDITTPVNTLKDDPEKWSKDPAEARFTYMMMLPELAGYDENLTVSGEKANYIENGKAVKRRALNGYDMPICLGISFNTVKVDNSYVVYAYGFENEFGDGARKTYSYNDYRHMLDSASENNYYGLTPDGTPAGVFDYTPFTWYGKDGNTKANGKIVFEAAVIKKGSNGEYERDRIYEIKGLTTKKAKNCMHATVSFNVGADGKWQKVAYNKFLPKPGDMGSEKNQPYFYPQFQCKKSYRDVNGDKHKADKDDKKFLKSINKELRKKDNRIKYEIRRRPIAGSVSSDYLSDGIPYVPYKYVSLIGDELDFKKNGKLKSAKLQFKSTTRRMDEDMDIDDIEKDVKAGEGNTTAKSAGYYLTHVLTTKNVKKSEQSGEIEKKILKGEFHKKEKTDLWIFTKSISGYDTLLVFGTNDFEGAAAFRKRDDKTIGAGYYHSDTDCFITSLDL